MSHTILVVEDDEELREMMREALEASGYSVVAAADGQEALDAFGSVDHVCMVFLDLLMPTMSGWEFFAKLRERSELASVPVIVHSSVPTQAPAGVTRVLQKPLKLDSLLDVVRECRAGCRV